MFPDYRFPSAGRNLEFACKAYARTAEIRGNMLVPSKCAECGYPVEVRCKDVDRPAFCCEPCQIDNRESAR